MPKVVDHDKRRRVVAEATWRVIERVGFEGATLRAIAEEIGYTTSVVSHYFRDKERLMEFAFRQGCRQVFERIDAESQHVAPGLPRLRIALERMMPDYLGNDASAKATLNYWGMAASVPALAKVHKENYIVWRGFLERFLAEAVNLRQIQGDIDIDLESSLLIALIDGILVGSVLEPDIYPRSVQRTLLKNAVARLTAGADRDGHLHAARPNRAKPSAYTQ